MSRRKLKKGQALPFASWAEKASLFYSMACSQGNYCSCNTHIHMAITMIQSKRIRLIKTFFTQSRVHLDTLLKKNARGNVALWQTRFWEHRIKNNIDLQKHVDYIHYNPVKHCYVKKPNEWLYSTIHRYIKMGWINEDWGT